jgi:hypothetical protein
MNNSISEQIQEDLRCLLDGYGEQEVIDAACQIVVDNFKKAREPITVKRWIRSGELNDSSKTQEEILEECGNLLDNSCSSEIIGEVLFEGTDGKYYTITTESIIGVASESFRDEILEEEEDEILEEEEGNE